MIQNVTRPRQEEVTDESFRAEIFDQPINVEPDRRDHLRDRIQQASRKNDTAALAYFSFSLAYNLDHFEPYDHKEAIRHLDCSINLFPNWPEAVFNRGVAHIHVKQYDKALNDFERANQLYFPSPTTNNVLRPTEVELTRGKLLLFTAEALAGRGLPGDLEMARLQLLRAETVLRDCRTLPHATFWLAQIDSRLNATFPKSSIEGPTPIGFTQHPIAFFFGVGISVVLLLLFCAFIYTADAASVSGGGSQRNVDIMPSQSAMPEPTPSPVSQDRGTVHPGPTDPVAEPSTSEPKLRPHETSKSP